MAVLVHKCYVVSSESEYNVVKTVCGEEYKAYCYSSDWDKYPNREKNNSWQKVNCKKCLLNKGKVT